MIFDYPGNMLLNGGPSTCIKFNNQSDSETFGSEKMVVTYSVAKYHKYRRFKIKCEFVTRWVRGLKVYGFFLLKLNLVMALFQKLFK